MDQQLLTQLQSTDPAERREAILALARSGDSRALKILKHVYENDSNLALRELARKAAQHLWRQINEQKRSAAPQQQTQKDIISTTQKVSPKPRKPRPLTLILLVAALIVLFVVGGYFVQAGYLDRYLVAIQRYGWEKNKQTVAGTEYYLIPPRGSAPTSGWPVVIALHGYGGNGTQMFPFADIFSRQGVIFVSPTFGNYEPMPGAGPIEPMRQILEHVSVTYPVDPRGAVLLGYSQGGTFAYRFSVYHPELVAGVVTAGAPDLDAGEPARFDLPYVFTWGENDGLQDLVLPDTVYGLIRRGYNVEYAVLEGAGHEVTPYAIERALQMINSQQ